MTLAKPRKALLNRGTQKEHGGVDFHHIPISAALSFFMLRDSDKVRALVPNMNFVQSLHSHCNLFCGTWLTEM